MSTCTLEYEFPPQQFQLSARRKLTFSPSEPLADVKLRIAKEIGLPEAIVPLLSCKEYNPMVALRDNASLLAALKYDFSRNARTDSHHRDVNLVLYKNADGTSQLIAPAFEDTNIEAASGEAALAADAFWRTGTRLGVSFSKTPPTEALVEVRTTGLDSSDPDLQASVIVLGLTDDSTVTDLQAKLATATSVRAAVPAAASPNARKARTKVAQPAPSAMRPCRPKCRRSGTQRKTCTLLSQRSPSPPQLACSRRSLVCTCRLLRK